MSLPTAVFLDTSILAGQQYNFASTAITTFLDVSKNKALTLLLPDPTKREVLRQIRERSSEAVQALQDAKRKAPFLSKWQHFPKIPDSRYGEWEVNRVALDEWNSFLKKFTVQELGYESVKMPTIMDWYESARAPFKEGKKRKEFPDAFAISALADHAQKTSTYVAVVSADPDFKAACERFPYLMYFPSLPALTELLLSDSKSVDAIKEAILANKEMLEEEARGAAEELGFYHWDSTFDQIEDASIQHLSIEDINVVGLGDRTSTITFEGQLSYEVRLRWIEHYSHFDREDSERMSGSVEDDTVISGTAKLSLSGDRSQIENVTYIELDQSEIEVSKHPR